MSAERLEGSERVSTCSSLVFLTPFNLTFYLPRPVTIPAMEHSEVMRVLIVIDGGRVSVRASLTRC